MRYTVVWKQTALDELAEIWLAASDRERISAAASSVDQLLGDDPEVKGDEFYGDFLLETPPLYITFSVNKQDRLVRVIQVWTK